MTTDHMTSPQLIAYSRPIEIDSLEVFAQALGGLTVYWQRGQYASAYAGIGAAAVVTADSADRFEATRHAIDAAFAGHLHDSNAPAEVRPRFFGGFAFDDAVDDDPMWRGFGGVRFILPRLLLTRVGGYHWLTVCDVGEGGAAERLAVVKEAFSKTQRNLESQPERIAPPLYEVEKGRGGEVSFAMRHDQWYTMVARGIDLIHDGALRKIVLARTLDAQFDTPVEPMPALATLEKQYPTAFRFLFSPSAGSAFFGATPELLARMSDGQLETAALAGSAPRGGTPDEDDRLAAALLASVKDRHEHALVADALREMITPLARTVEMPSAPTIVKLKHIQHLFTPVSAQLKEHGHILRVVERLHPTPALGGSPQREAQAAIRQLEPITRGWYAAPIGWVDANGDGEFAVAIRSAVAQGAQVRLYAGAGIVGDSDPDKEWDETTLKFKPLMGALGLSYPTIEHRLDITTKEMVMG
jgi:menaquinone-specific isochorismate synthase